MAGLRQALLACVLSVSAASVMALDVNDINELLANGVQDSVIINMVQGNKLDRPLSAREIVSLTRAGASQPLLEYLTSAGAANQSYVASQPAPVYVEPAPTVVQQQPNVIVQQPPTVVTQAPTVVYEAPTVVYETPTYYYPQSYVYPQPYYYPYRSGPSFNFSFGGSRHRYGPPRGGHHPPSHGRPGGGRHGGRR